MKFTLVSVNASFPINSIEEGRSALPNFVHLQKASSSINVTDEGIVICTNDAHNLKANFLSKKNPDEFLQPIGTKSVLFNLIYFDILKDLIY